MTQSTAGSMASALAPSGLSYTPALRNDYPILPGRTSSSRYRYKLHYTSTTPPLASSPGTAAYMEQTLSIRAYDLRAMADVGRLDQKDHGPRYVFICSMVYILVASIATLDRCPLYLVTNSYLVEFLLLVRHHLPKTLKRLSIFEDFNDNLSRTLANSQLLGVLQVNTTRIINSEIGKAFAFRSLDLEQLSLSYLVDAKDFFQACMQTWTWQHLQSLALTSELLQSTRSREVIYALLSSAGISVLQMPRLHTFVLWNGTRGNACAFIYDTDRYSAHLTWRSTWDLELIPCVVKVWQHVASKLHSAGLSIKKQKIQASIGSHGDAIHYLSLPCQVVAPASLWQIRKEGGQWTT